MKKSYTHLFFDLDDTLWDFSKNSDNALRRLFSEYRLDTYFESYEYFHSIYLLKNSSLWDLYGQGAITKSYLSYERFAYPLRVVGIENSDLVNALGRDYLSFTSSGTVLISGAIELLESLKDRYVLSILSNGFKEVQYLKLKNSDLLKYFRYIILSEEVGVLKPNRIIFDESLKISNCSVGKALMIGDNFESDVKGSLACGWDAIYFNRFNEVINERTNGIIEVNDLTSIKLLL